MEARISSIDGSFWPFASLMTTIPAMRSRRKLGDAAALGQRRRAPS
jgi:hypothetical protein